VWYKKKIIALSTLSQLGIIITRIGLNAPSLAFFHILTHALFKALLFICAGSYINSHLHAQDLRWIGNLTIQIPIASSCIRVANIALCGFPFIAGFYSKDIIIESAINIPNNIFIVSLALLRVGLTSFYSIRFSLVTMWSSNSCSRIINIRENYIIIFPMVTLSLISVISGRSLSWVSPIRNSLFILPIYLKVAPLLIVLIGLLTGWYLTTNISTLKAKLVSNNLNHWASCTIWFLVPLSSQFIIKIPLITSHHLIKTIDQGWLETISGQGSNSQLLFINNKIISLIPKSPTSYLVSASTFILSSIIIIIIY